MRTTLLILCVILFTGCATTPPESRFTSCPAGTSELQICTMEFIPVCGQTQGNEWRTYSNACDACASGAQQYVKEACEYQEEPLK